MTKSTWSDDRVELLKSLWGAGKSAAEIAQQLGGGISRNAVIGKAHRLGLSGRASPVQKKVDKVAAAAIARAAAEEVSYERSPTGVNLLQLSDKTCRWPIGDPKREGFHFCGSRPMPGVPYCGHHSAVAYQNTTRKVSIKESAAAGHSDDALEELDGALSA